MSAPADFPPPDPPPAEPTGSAADGSRQPAPLGQPAEGPSGADDRGVPEPVDLSDSGSSGHWVPLIDLPSQGLSDLHAEPTMGFDASGLDASGVEASGMGDTLLDETPIPEMVGGYRVGRRIGRGGMGEVYLAEHRSMGRKVALKILPARWLGRAESVERFYEEIRAASRLLHPNIVTAFDAGQAEGIHYLAMEYVEGQTLAEVVAAEGPMPIGDAASAIRQAAFALHHAHSANIVHRDVKPGNLMRSVDGTIKLLDLGLARVAALANAIPESKRREPTQKEKSPDPNDPSSPSANSEPLRLESPRHESPRPESPRPFVGTLSYISPEQLEDAAVADARSDQYSLGATLFFLLAGRPPFVGELIDQVYGHRHGQIPDLMLLRQDVDLTLANIVRRMLAKNPSERYGSMDEVARAMAPYDNDRSTPAWVLDFARRELNEEHSTVTGDSTRRSTLRVMGIDLGMTHAATVMTTDGVTFESGLPGRATDGPQRLFRMAVAQYLPAGDAEGGRILFGRAAYELRQQYPERVAHCQMMYFGRDDMFRRLGGRMCSPEITTAMCLRRIVANTLAQLATGVTPPVAGVNASSSVGGSPLGQPAGANLKRHAAWPDAVAITVPGCYDQLHRRAIMSAARLAGLPSIRLVDRSIATVRAALLDEVESEPTSLGSPLSASVPLDRSPTDETRPIHFLVVGLSGQALDVSVVRYRDRQLDLLATAGHWSVGSMAWSGRLVELIASQIPDAPLRARRSPTNRRELVLAAKIQMAGERALNSLLLIPEATVEIEHQGRRDEVRLTRQAWLSKCEDLIGAIEQAIERGCEQAGVPISAINRCLVSGPILRLPAIRDRVLSPILGRVNFEFFDRVDAARGAAACVAAELPGHRHFGLPVRTTASQSIGFVIEEPGGRRKILPIIPRGTSLPARTNRQLAGKAKNGQLTLSLVESSGIDGDRWQTLGRQVIDVGAAETNPSRRLGFEVDINGLLSIHLERPELGRTVMLPPLPLSGVDSTQWLNWREWIEANC